MVGPSIHILDFAYVSIVSDYYQRNVNRYGEKGSLALTILHDHSNIVDGDKISKECNKALSQSVSSFLNPVKVLALFKKMLDEVYALIC